MDLRSKEYDPYEGYDILVFYRMLMPEEFTAIDDYNKFYAKRFNSLDKETRLRVLNDARRDLDKFYAKRFDASTDEAAFRSLNLIRDEMENNQNQKCLCKENGNYCTRLRLVRGLQACYWPKMR